MAWSPAVAFDALMKRLVPDLSDGLAERNAPRGMNSRPVSRRTDICAVISNQIRL